MIRKLFQQPAITTFFVIGLLLAQTILPAQADDEDPRLEISADHLPPGMILQVRGVNLAREQQVVVSLVGIEGEFQDRKSVV